MNKETLIDNLNTAVEAHSRVLKERVSLYESVMSHPHPDMAEVNKRHKELDRLEDTHYEDIRRLSRALQ